MLKRTITSIVFVLVIFPIYFFSDTIVFPIAVALLSLLGIYEILGCIGMRSHAEVSVPAFLLAGVTPLLTRNFASRYTFLAFLTLILFAYLLYLLALGVFSHRRLDLEKLATTYMCVVYIVTAFVSMILLRDRPFGMYLLFIAMFGPWGSDVFAYLCGRFFGRHKQIPDVSPKKTVEGALGAVIFCGIAAVAFGYIVSLLDPSIEYVGYFALLLAGMVVSVVAQVGDLIFSFIKRKYDVKDYGKILPGHGGILDRFDSVLGVVPTMVILGELPHIFDFFG